MLLRVTVHLRWRHPNALHKQSLKMSESSSCWQQNDNELAGCTVSAGPTPNLTALETGRPIFYLGHGHPTVTMRKDNL